MLSTWLSYDDLTQLIERGLFTADVGHTVVYGASDNRTVWWDNRYAEHLGYQPKDTSGSVPRRGRGQTSARRRRPEHGLPGWRLRRCRPLQLTPPCQEAPACTAN
jgi:hypothetical protein